MAFLLFEPALADGRRVLRCTNEAFSLAGHNLVWRAWKERNRPVREGWHVSAEELIRIQSDGCHTRNTRRLVVDFHPRAKRRIGLIELLDVYAYTYRDEETPPDEASWTVMMLRMKDLFYRTFEHDISVQEKSRLIAQVPEPPPGPEFNEFLEFLYLNGFREGWNWGNSGRTNAAFLYEDARAYFRRFF